MSDHVPVDPALALPAHYRYVEDYLRGIDGQLRLRRSANHPGFYVLERRVRRTRPAATPRRDLSDQHVAARDGYVHVTTVHPWFLDRPQRIIDRLRADGGDLHATGNSGQRWWDQAQAAEAEAKAKRSEARYQEFRDYYKESFDTLERVGGEGGTDRTRLNNPGLPPGSLAGETPAQEVSSEHQTPPPCRGEDGGLHHQAAGG